MTSTLGGPAGTILLILGLILGLCCFAWGLFANLKGWQALGSTGVFLIVWLPAVSALSVLTLVAIGARSRWPWMFIAGLLVCLGSVEWSLFERDGNGRWPLCFPPLVLTCFTIIALLTKGAVAQPNWMYRAGIVLAM